MTTCTTCGARHERKLPLVDERTGKVSFRRKTAHLSSQQAAVMRALVEAHPNDATWERLAYAVWGGEDGPENKLKALSVRLTQLRAIGRDLGFEIRTTYNVGPRLEVL